MTPIQELKEQLVEEDIRGLSIDYYLQKEKEFAKQCFEAGKYYGMDIINSIDWAENPTKPDFDNFYKQFEQ